MGRLHHLLGAAILVLSATTTYAWSQLSTSGNRRVFLEKVVGGSVVSTSVAGGFATVEPAFAYEFQKSKSNIYQPDPNSLDGKVILITGGSSGLGLESAKRLAAAGAVTILTTRSDSKGEKAVTQVQSYLQERSIQNQNVFSLTLDLDDLGSVKSFPQRYERKFGSSQKIDVLMNNAGVAAIPNRETTRDGFERTFQSNHLGPFLLTSLLFPYLNQENGARIINVSSIAYTLIGAKGLNLNNLNCELEYKADGWQAYSQSKLENILFSQELQRRANEKGMDWLSVSALHPGTVGTDIWRNTFVGNTNNGGTFTNPVQSLTSKLFYRSLLTTEEGSNTQIWLAALPAKDEVAKGQYFDEFGNMPKMGDFAKDKNAAVVLWDRSEALLGVKFQVQ